jgi:hypothetical protein
MMTWRIFWIPSFAPGITGRGVGFVAGEPPSGALPVHPVMKILVSRQIQIRTLTVFIYRNFFNSSYRYSQFSDFDKRIRTRIPPVVLFNPVRTSITSTSLR